MEKKQLMGKIERQNVKKLSGVCVFSDFYFQRFNFKISIIFQFFFGYKSYILSVPIFS